MPQPESDSIYHTPFSRPLPLRRGSLTPRLMKCGKPECACHTDPTKRHGPYFSLTRAVGGETKSRYLSTAEADAARRQIEHGALLREDYERYWKDCETLADTELVHIRQTESSADGGKKGASHRKSMRSSRRKSTS